MEMIEKKAKGEEIVTQPAVQERPHRVVNLMAALEQSLEAAQKSGGGTSRTRKRAASGDGGEPAKKPARRGGSRAKASKK